MSETRWLYSGHPGLNKDSLDQEISRIQSVVTTGSSIMIAECMDMFRNWVKKAKQAVSSTSDVNGFLSTSNEFLKLQTKAEVTTTSMKAQLQGVDATAVKGKFQKLQDSCKVRVSFLTQCLRLFNDKSELKAGLGCDFGELQKMLKDGTDLQEHMRAIEALILVGSESSDKKAAVAAYLKHIDFFNMEDTPTYIHSKYSTRFSGHMQAFTEFAQGVVDEDFNSAEDKFIRGGLVEQVFWQAEDQMKFLLPPLVKREAWRRGKSVSLFRF